MVEDEFGGLFVDFEGILVIFYMGLVFIVDYLMIGFNIYDECICFWFNGLGDIKVVSMWEQIFGQFCNFLIVFIIDSNFGVDYVLMIYLVVCCLVDEIFEGV